MAKQPITISVQFNKLPQLRGQPRREAPKVVAQTALAIEARAKELAPVDTGDLQGGIQAKKQDALSWTVEPSVEYAAHVEFGTHKMSAQPYLTPAAEQERTGFIEQMEKLLDG